MSFLAIDVGNTRLKWALFDGPHPGGRPLRQGAVFLETIESLAEQHWQCLPAPEAMLGCCVAGDTVRWRVEEQLEQVAGWDLDPRWVAPAAREAGLTNGYDHPGRLGSDRWVAMIGARRRVLDMTPAGTVPRPALVAMVGTAVTVDAVDGAGVFLGGLILPGFGLMQHALELGTSALRVPTGEVTDFPTNTSDALMSGGVNAMAGAIERQHRKLRQRCGADPLLLMSGGAAAKLRAATDLPFEVVDGLVFEGLLAVHQQRRSR
jgi:type III pantothenate kinase